MYSTQPSALPNVSRDRSHDDNEGHHIVFVISSVRYNRAVLDSILPPRLTTLHVTNSLTLGKIKTRKNWRRLARVFVYLEEVMSSTGSVNQIATAQWMLLDPNLTCLTHSCMCQYFCFSRFAIRPTTSR